jgi:hypothetical protein
VTRQVLILAASSALGESLCGAKHFQTLNICEPPLGAASAAAEACRRLARISVCQPLMPPSSLPSTFVFHFRALFLVPQDNTS